MSYEVNGAKGYYDKFVDDDSVKYGMNASSNHKKLAVSPITSDKSLGAPLLDFMPTEAAAENNAEMVEKFIDDNDAYLNSLLPLQYEYRYMPNIKKGEIDKKALFGAALEEMGRPDVPVKDFEDAFLLDKNTMTAEPIDINKDGKIDVTEYSTTMLAADMMSKPNPDVSEIDGTMNDKGMNAVLEYTKKSNAEAAAKMYSNLYNHFKLNTL